MAPEPFVLWREIMVSDCSTAARCLQFHGEKSKEIFSMRISTIPIRPCPSLKFSLEVGRISNSWQFYFCYLASDAVPKCERK